MILSGRSPSAADNLHPAHPDGAPFVAVEPEADRIRAPAVDAVTVEVVEKIKGSVTAGGVRTIKVGPRLPQPPQVTGSHEGSSFTRCRVRPYLDSQPRSGTHIATQLVETDL